MANVLFDQLCRALEKGNEENVKKVMSRFSKPSLTQKDEDGNTVLHWTVVGDNANLLKHMIQRGANPTTPNIWGDAPIHWAAQLGRSRLLRQLVSHPIDPNVKGFRGDSPMHRAARFGHVECVESLKADGAAVDAPNDLGFLPIHEAVLAGHTNVVKALIKAGAKVNVPLQRTGDTPLHMAARLGWADIMSLLQDNGGDLTVKNASGDTPLKLRPPSSPELNKPKSMTIGDRRGSNA